MRPHSDKIKHPMSETGSTWVVVKHPEKDLYRRECTCGNRGVWLSDISKVRPCPYLRTITPLCQAGVGVSHVRAPLDKMCIHCGEKL